MVPIAIKHKKEILEAVERGDRLLDIANKVGLKTHSGILYALGDDPEYHAAKLAGAHARLENREIELEGAKTMPDISRSRELLSHQRWRCEREFPNTWAPKQQVLAKIVIEPDAGLIGRAAELLDQICGTVVQTAITDQSEVEDGELGS